MRNIAVQLAVGTPATLRLDRTGRAARLVLEGDWVVAEAARMDAVLHTFDFGGATDLVVDGSKIHQLDSAGAWLVLRTRHLLEAKGIRIADVLLPEIDRALYRRLETDALAPAAVLRARRCA